MADETPALDLIPRSVRDKLDRIGIKLHLREWQALTLEERGDLCREPCGSPTEITTYRVLVVRLVQARTGRTPDTLPGRGES
jgi:hypothetical protein